MNKALSSLLAAVSLLLLPACSLAGYHMGGLKPDSMKELNTFAVEMFDNHSTQPMAGMLLTNALTDAMQRDGTYRLATSSHADFIIKGEVTHLSRESLLTDPDDTYLSREVGVTVHVRYTVQRVSDGKVIMERKASGQGSYFTDAGSQQSSVDSALSYAARHAAEEITNDLTTP